MEPSRQTGAIVSDSVRARTNIYRNISNGLFVLAAVCGIVGLVMGTRSLSAPGLAAQMADIDLRDVTAGDTIPVTFTLVNHSSEPIRLLGADEP